MADGAHLNMDAEGAMRTIVGGEEGPTPRNEWAVEKMIRKEPMGDDGFE